MPAVWNWSRTRLIFSIVTCEGLLATLRERVQYAPAPARETTERASDTPPALPRCYDYAGALHIHSTYSDGLGTVPEVAKAANIAGLDFLVLCDHNNLDARRNGEDGWQGRTLVLVGTEITTSAGHLLALNVPPSFLPAPDDAREAQKAIVDSGGLGFIALPCDLKGHWRDFRGRLPGIGLEVFNLSAIARTKINLPAFLLAWLRYRGQTPERAFHLVEARPTRELRLWDSLTHPSDPDQPARPVVAIASLDAHAVMKFAGRSYPYPTYEEVFRTLRTHIVTRTPLSYANSDADAAIVHGALAAGHCYMAYDNFADPTGFAFEALPTGGGPDAASVSMGDAIIAPGTSGEVHLRVRVPRTRSLVRLYHNGKLVAAARGGCLDYATAAPGVYRAEVFLYRRRLGRLCFGARPWIFSNPIYVQPARLPAQKVSACSPPAHSL